MQVDKKWREKLDSNQIEHLISKVKLATIVEGDQKAPFSIATTTRCRGGHYYFPGLLHFTLDTYFYC